MLKKQSFFTFKDILPSVIENLSRQNIQDHTCLDKLWKEILKADADKAVIYGIKEGTLLVTVDCGARLFQMRMRKQTLLTKIQKTQPDIKNIIFRIGKVK